MLSLDRNVRSSPTRALVAHTRTRSTPARHLLSLAKTPTYVLEADMVPRHTAKALSKFLKLVAVWAGVCVRI